jgi:hypothetical protein
MSADSSNSVPEKFISNGEECSDGEDFFMEEIHISFYSGEECGYVCIDGTMDWNGNDYNYNLTFSSDNCKTFTVSGRMGDSGLPPVKGNDVRTSAIAIYYVSR